MHIYKGSKSLIGTLADYKFYSAIADSGLVHVPLIADLEPVGFYLIGEEEQIFRGSQTRSYLISTRTVSQEIISPPSRDR